MPVKLNSKLPTDDAEARIEIIPLIDIMFFLLASFMLVSLSMVNLKAVKVNLPTATVATDQSRKNLVDVSVNKAGQCFLDKQRMTDAQLLNALVAARRSNSDVRIFISADRDARHGDVIRALDLVRTAGIDKVAFEITPSTPGTNP